MDRFKRIVFDVFLVVFYSYCILESAYYLYLGGIKIPRVFRGYFHFWFAKKYADKRHDNWKACWDQSGKRQGILPYTDTTLIVCSAGELKRMGKRKLLKARINPRKAIHKAYYTTQP
jgi:hypothetical protein